MSNFKIAVIDDDIYIGNMIEECLKREGYQVFRAYSGTEALLLLQKIMPDLILLDLMLPGMTGEEVLLHIKNIPVIVVSAKAGIDDKINVLLDGAADYITKPFNTKELLARIKVQLRGNKLNKQLTGVLSYDKIILNLDTFEVIADGASVKLTKTEYAILKVLMSESPAVLSKNKLIEAIEQDTPDCEESSLKTHVANLRNKLKAAAGKDYIEAVWGIGYKLKS